jgi:plasmid stability protein
MMYALMHRTQLLLDDWQYQALKARAEAEGRSISDLVRALVASYLEGRGGHAARRLAEISGVGEGPPDGAAQHDHYLYGWPKETADSVGEPPPAAAPPRARGGRSAAGGAARARRGRGSGAQRRGGT